MADDLTKTGKQDRLRINVNQDHEVRDWASTFGVTPEALRAAVQAVGPLAADVEKHLAEARMHRAVDSDLS